MREIKVVETRLTNAEEIILKIKEITKKVNQTALEGAIEIGIYLKQLKEISPHGKWEEYVEKNLMYSVRKARQLMQIANHYGDKENKYFKAISKRQISAELSYSTAVKLMSIPEEKIEEFTDNVEIEKLKVEEVDEAIKKFKDIKSDEDKTEENRGTEEKKKYLILNKIKLLKNEIKKRNKKDIYIEALEEVIKELKK